MTTPSPDRSHRSLLRHAGYCGRREPCWRAECRAEWPDVNTVEVLASGVMLAYCHGESATPADIRRELWCGEAVVA